MKISKKTIFAVVIGLSLLALVITPALAQPDIGVGLEDVQTQTQYSDQELTVTIGKIIKLVLGFLGLIALILFIVGGFKWMTSGGNEENISEAKKLMSAAIVGLFIIIIAYAATTFIINRLTGTVASSCETGQVRCVEKGVAKTIANGGVTGKYIECVDEVWDVSTRNSCGVNSGGGPAKICEVGRIAANITGLGCVQ
ncbi:hypothetical protein HQ544_00395 [Candidatus Falkowbacteria bacterium]|nr:hypothetical protein [Candidatus Falkowbacteria bacterium]